MQFLTNSKIPFLKYRSVFVWVSAALLLVTVAELFILGGINFGIDFTGGTQLTVKMRDEISVDDLRNALSDAGLREVQIQTYGEAGANEALIKTPIKEGSEEGSSNEVIDALDVAFNGDRGAKLDLNQRGRNDIASLLQTADPDGKAGEGLTASTAHYDAVGGAVVTARQANTIFTSMDQVTSAEGVSPAAASLLESQGYIGSFLIRSNESGGPQIGSVLRTKGYLAVILSLIGMLMYIWYRFELRFGIGALVAVFHDFLITLGLFALIDFEFNLSTIAAFLTLVGYSVNDTVVIFDRVRENMRRFRRRPLEDLMNLSINQTLSRTVLTSSTTLLVVGSLFFAGGDVLRPFSFVLMIGIIIGTYSSIFVASPFALLWERWTGSEDDDKKPAKAS
ncbi:MAG: protein translocase subunit SecF [Acidobacteriota bacterium]